MGICHSYQVPDLAYKEFVAASEQLKAIEKIWRVKGKEYLPENLEALAEIRYENADLSLSELAEMCNPPLSRSGVNHRLKKIISIANEL